MWKCVCVYLYICLYVCICVCVYILLGPDNTSCQSITLEQYLTIADIANDVAKEISKEYPAIILGQFMLSE